MGRRKLELLPRTSSTATSPVGSPKAPAPARANPFGAAKPVDASAKEKEVEEKLARDREARLKDRSNDASLRTGPSAAERTPPSVAAEPAGGNWREKRTTQTPTGHSRPTSANHSRATSHDGASTPPTPAKKHQSPFSFAALANEIPVAEGEEEEATAEEPAPAKAVEA